MISRISTLWLRATRFPWVTMALVTWGVTALGTGVARADTGVVGFGDLLPKLSVPAGSSPSLFEATNGLAWTLDWDPGMGFDQVIITTMNAIVNVVWALVVLLAQSALYLGQWILSMVNLPGVNDWLSTGLGTSASGIMSWLAPTAIVIGALVAFIQHKGGEGLDQVLWVMVSAMLGMSLALSPAMWINGTQNLRTIGTDAVLTLASPAAGPDQQKPFAWPATDYAAATTRDAMIRKSNDAVFRGLVVYPWCIAEFGSLAACEKYGASMIKAGTDGNERKKVISEVSRAEGGDDKPATRWLKGYNWPERLAMVIASLIVVLIFCGVLLVLAFAAIGALIRTVLHLLLGAFFTLTWCIPGKPRQIGMRWLESLIGTVLQGIIAVGVFGATLTLLTLIYSNVDALGGVLVVSALAIATVISALTFRSEVASWFGIVGGGRAGAAVLGAAAMRILTKSGGGVRFAGRTAKAAGKAASAGGRAVVSGTRAAAKATADTVRWALVPPRRPVSGSKGGGTTPPPRRTPPPAGGGPASRSPGSGGAPSRRPASSQPASDSARRPSGSAARRPTSTPSSTRRADPARRPTPRSGRDGAAPPPARRRSPRRPKED